jgi:hypothetical protein
MGCGDGAVPVRGDDAGHSTFRRLRQGFWKPLSPGGWPSVPDGVEMGAVLMLGFRQ